MCCGGPSIDYTALAKASERTAEIMSELGYDQLQFSKDQYEESKPFLQDIAKKQSAAMDEQLRQAKDYYDYQTQTFRPMEQGLVSDAEKFSTDGYQQRLARQAAADAGLAFRQSNQANRRAMRAMGVNPNSGKFASMQQQGGLNVAAAKAGAMTGARERATDMGWAKRLDAAGLGRNLPGASTAAYTSATGAGNAAGSNFQSPGSNYMAGAGQAANTVGSGQQMQLNGLSSILNAQASLAANSGGGLSGVLGTVAGAGLNHFFPSDRRLKENIKWVGRDSRTGLPIYRFSYRDDPSHVVWEGVMADDVERVVPEAVHYDMYGVAMVDYGLLDIEFKRVH